MSGITVRLDGLDDLVERKVAEALASRDGQVAEDPWYSSSAAAKYMDVSLQRVHDLVSAGLLPRHGERGERLAFRRSELDRYMEQRR
jgi:excisionase family DNA binding protein